LAGGLLGDGARAIVGVVSGGIARMHRHHDMGGEPAGPVVPEEHDYAAWEKRVDAILRLLTHRQVITVDELRRGIEELGPGAYDEISYYQRWIASVGNNLLEKGVITVDELGRKLAEVEARWRAAGRQGEARS
jgi:Nitrile hydratase beta subunit